MILWNTAMPSSHERISRRCAVRGQTVGCQGQESMVTGLAVQRTYRCGIENLSRMLTYESGISAMLDVSPGKFALYSMSSKWLSGCYNLRWEDFEYTYVQSKNRFAYFGNGWTSKETDLEHDMVSYLKKESEIDLRDLHERWWDL